MARSPRRQRTPREQHYDRLAKRSAVKAAAGPTPTDVANEVLTKAATSQQKIWEHTPEGKARMTGSGEQPGTRSQKYPGLPVGRTGMPYGMSRQMHSFLTGRGASDDPAEPSIRHSQVLMGPVVHHEVQQSFPGMGGEEHEVHTPERWNDLSPEEQQKGRKGAAKFGTDIDTMKRSISAQRDQAYERAESLGGSGAKPYSENFYGKGSEEHQRVASSARELGIPRETHALMNAITSPQSEFKHEYKGKRKGDVSYPNDELAKAAVRQAQSGVAPEDARAPKGVAGMHGNVGKAVAVFQHLQQGVPTREIRTGVSAKTGPYTNAQNPNVKQFFVSDVQSGGGGMLPHLGDTAPKGKKTEQESAIEQIPHFHAQANEAAERAMRETGDTHMRMFQAGQWGENKVQKAESGRSKMSSGEKVAYPASRRLQPRQFDPGQREMMKQGHFKEEKPKLSATPEGEPNQFAPGSRWTF